MKLRTLVMAVAVLAALSLLVFFVNRPEPAPAADPRVGKPLVDPATVEKASRITLSDQGKTVELVKQPDGSWRVPGYHDFPADFAKLSTFVGDLTRANVQRLVTSAPDRIARLEFKDTRVALADATNAPLWSATLGKTAERGGRYLRFGDEPKAFIADFNAWLDSEPKNWADATLVAIKPEEVASLEIALAGGPAVEVSRPKKEEPFTAKNGPAGQTIRADKITGVLSTISGLRFTDTTEPSDEKAAAARAAARTFKVTTFDGKTLTVALGRKPEQQIVKAPPAQPADAATTLGEMVSAATKGTPTTPDAPPASPAGDAKPLEPLTETVPAGPVYAFITHSDAGAPVNAIMQKRAFQVADYAFTSLPQKAEDLFEPDPTPPPPTAAP